MAVVTGGRVDQGNLAGSLLIYNDTGTGYGTITSRTLLVYDCNSNLIDTVSMGVTLTADITITADAYFKFICTVIDNTGTYTTTVNYLATGFYVAAYLAAIAQYGWRPATFAFLDQAELFLAAAQRFLIPDLGIQANNNVIAANIYCNMQQ